MSNESKKYAVIGYPIEHSRSPELYAPMFEKFGIKAEFDRIAVKEDELSSIREIAAERGLSGFAVTMPHKRAILPYLDEISDFAQRACSVNIVTVDNGRLIGHNTDGAGALNALTEAGVDVSARSAVVLGSGGAASAINLMLVQAGCTVKTVSRRRAATGRPYPIEDAIFSLEALSGGISDADLLINATPLGMTSSITFADLSFLTLLKPSCTVMDVVYRADRETRLIKTAAQRGLKTIPGDRMLYHQGVLAFKLWTGFDYTE